MNTFLVIANVLAILAFFIHTIMGDREIHLLHPIHHAKNDINLLEKWTMVRCGWHWVSFDLLLASIGLAVVNFSNYFEEEKTILQFMSFYFISLAFFWIVTILVSKPFPGRFVKLGQWILLLVIGGLVYLGIG